MSDRDEAARILHQVMGDPRFADSRYLDWLYGEQPVGTTVEVVLRDDAGRPTVCGAAIPQQLRRADDAGLFVVIVNIAVPPHSRGNNLFANAILDHVPLVVGQGGIGGYGVTNERSTHPATSLQGLGASLVCPLPVRLCVPTRLRGHGVESWPATPEFLAGDRFAELAAELDDYPATEWVHRFTPEVLRWRLSRPDVTYAVHASNNVVCVSMGSSVKGVPVAILLKFLPRGGSRGPLPSAELVAAACRFHRAPVALYAGFNAHVPVAGVDLPRRFLPKPLNLLFLTLSDLDPTSFRFDTFEFLDFDAF